MASVGDNVNKVGSAGAGKREYTIDDFRPHFMLPLTEAAKLLGVCGTNLKIYCRKFGIVNWPYRKLTTLQKNITRLEDQCRECEIKGRTGKCEHPAKIAELNMLIKRIIDNPSEVKEIVAPGASFSVGSTSTSAHTSNTIASTRKSADETILSTDPFIKHLQTKNATGKRKRAGTDGYMPSRQLPTLSQYFDEILHDDYLCQQALALNPTAQKTPLVTNQLRKGWEYDEDECSIYKGAVKVEVAVDEDPLCRSKRSHFVAPVLLPAFDVQPQENDEHESILLEPRGTDQPPITLVPRFCFTF